MSVYAILGATGQTGGSILQVLSQRPNQRINAFVRSKAKLESKYPELCASPSLQIFEGNISNTAVLAQCIKNTRAVFLAVATSDNIPGCRIAQDQAEAVVFALEIIRRGDKASKLPTLVMLSSSETEDRLVQDIPFLIRRLLFQCNYFVYTDLIAAEKYLRARGCWINTVYFKPGGISHDVARGHVLSAEGSQTFVSFLDVAGGMVEAADEEERWAGRSVSVLSRGKARVEWANGWLLLKNLLVTLVPGLYSWVF